MKKSCRGAIGVFRNFCLFVVFIIGMVAIVSSCGDGSGGGGDSGSSSPTGSLTGSWEGVMYPGYFISFVVEEINGEYYITAASGSYAVVGCFASTYGWGENDLKIKIVNNECHIYLEEEISIGDDRGMEIHIYFDSNLKSHGTWVGETHCEPFLIEGNFEAYRCVDNDNDGYDSCNECDDDNANINWDADEICDGVDNDCDGKIDEGVFYPDFDQDGYGDDTAAETSCPVPESYVANNIDCNDNDNSVKPGAVELPGDGIDQNCDGEIDEPASSRPRFTDLNDGTVRDNDSGLIWLKDASCGELAGTNSFGQSNWSTAMNAAAVLGNGVCGLSDGSAAGDWRLPTKDEWDGFVDKGFEGPALCNGYGSEIWTEGDTFIGVPYIAMGSPLTTNYWSSTEVDDNAVWTVMLANGAVGPGYYNKGVTYFVWPVR